MSKEQGLSLADLAKLTTSVPIFDDKYIEVQGVSAATALDLLRRFPHLLEKGLQGGTLNISDLFGAAPEAIAAVIAAGVGQPNDPAAEANAAAIPIELQMDILEAIGTLTFRSGFGPFVERLKSLIKGVQASGSRGAVPDMRSPLASNS